MARQLACAWLDQCLTEMPGMSETAAHRAPRSAMTCLAFPRLLTLYHLQAFALVWTRALVSAVPLGSERAATGSRLPSLAAPGQEHLRTRSIPSHQNAPWLKKGHRCCRSFYAYRYLPHAQHTPALSRPWCPALRPPRPRAYRKPPPPPNRRTRLRCPNRTRRVSFFLGSKGRKGLISKNRNFRSSDLPVNYLRNETQERFMIQGIAERVTLFAARPFDCTSRTSCTARLARGLWSRPNPARRTRACSSLASLLSRSGCRWPLLP